MADLLGKRASALESLTITNNTDDLRMELLASCSKTLKELDLFGEYKGGKDLELVIPKMPFLRILKTRNYVIFKVNGRNGPPPPTREIGTNLV